MSDLLVIQDESDVLVIDVSTLAPREVSALVDGVADAYGRPVRWAVVEPATHPAIADAAGFASALEQGGSGDVDVATLKTRNMP